MQTTEPKTVTINPEQRLFVIPCEDGYSCLGFDVLERRAIALGSELVARFYPEYQAQQPEVFGTIERYHQYERMVEFARLQNQKTGWRSNSELTKELIGLEGKRVTVRHQWESGTIETSEFTVGKSCGFIPCHLALKHRNSSGGPAVCLGKILSVRVKA